MLDKKQERTKWILLLFQEKILDVVRIFSASRYSTRPSVNASQRHRGSCSQHGRQFVHCVRRSKIN